jgi:tRNA-dihydrouridine synthase B
VVYRKCAGGGLLREPNRIDAILGALREAVTVPFTVKTRLGFASPAEFDDLLALFARHDIDLLTVHGRTVAQMYRPGVRYDLIAQAARSLRCPVLANGNVYSAEQALACWPRPGARVDDWPRRDPQSVVVPADSPASDGPCRHPSHRRDVLATLGNCGIRK